MTGVPTIYVGNLLVLDVDRQYTHALLRFWFRDEYGKIAGTETGRIVDTPVQYGDLLLVVPEGVLRQ